MYKLNAFIMEAQREMVSMQLVRFSAMKTQYVDSGVMSRHLGVECGGQTLPVIQCVFLSPTHVALSPGWLLHRSPEVGGEGERERALELLREASQSKPDCGETWYLLGRCATVNYSFQHCPSFLLRLFRVLVTHQKCHEAFAAYQRAIHYPSKVSPANTWHSIG